MKTKGQRQRESLVRRQHDLDDLLARYAKWQDCVKMNANAPVEYRECVVATCSLDEPNGYPDGYDEFCEIYNSYRRHIPVDQAELFWHGKINAAKRDIENLRAKIGA